MIKRKVAQNVLSVHSAMKLRMPRALSVARISLLRPRTAQTAATAVSTIHKLFQNLLKLSLINEIDINTCKFDNSGQKINKIYVIFQHFRSSILISQYI